MALKPWQWQHMLGLIHIIQTRKQREKDKWAYVLFKEQVKERCISVCLSASPKVSAGPQNSTVSKQFPRWLSVSEIEIQVYSLWEGILLLYGNSLSPSLCTERGHLDKISFPHQSGNTFKWNADILIGDFLRLPNILDDVEIFCKFIVLLWKNNLWLFQQFKRNSHMIRWCHYWLCISWK